MTACWFNARKAAQVAAFFVNNQGQQIDILKLVKLIYLANRENMRAFGFPIIDDQFVSMPHGPVNSVTLNCINGFGPHADEWDAIITARANHAVGATKVFNRDELDELSDAEFRSLELVWKNFGHMTKWQIRDWTHENCPEWEDPNGSAHPIPHSRVFKFLQVPDPEDMADAIEADRNMEDVFARLRA